LFFLYYFSILGNSFCFVLFFAIGIAFKNKIRNSGNSQIDGTVYAHKLGRLKIKKKNEAQNLIAMASFFKNGNCLYMKYEILEISRLSYKVSA